MFKKILFLFVLFFSLIFKINASSIPVEKVFLDIDKNYKYYNELQTLYDKGMILPDNNGYFNPYKLLTRSEFVGIAQEVSCKKCIKPNTDIYFLDNYKNKPFYDVGENNKYFYCIADAKANLFVKGYDPSYTCNDGTYREGEKPFCINNTITLEESLAVLFRMSGLLTNIEAEKIINDIKEGKNFPNISSDVGPMIDENHIYFFYPYFKKAFDYELLSYDDDGNEISYKFLKFDGDKLRPNQPISKEKFLTMAFIALKANSCLSSENENSLAVSISILDKKCNSVEINCDSSDLKDPNSIYDYRPIIGGYCDAGLVDDGIVWKFSNLDSSEEIIIRGKYLDNFDFLGQCKSSKCNNWKVSLNVTDNCQNTGESSFNFNLDDNSNTDDLDNGFGLGIKAGPLSGEGPLEVDFESMIDGGEGPYKCSWDYGDGTTGEGELTDHIYTKDGIYEVVLKCIDSNGSESEATTIINVGLDEFGLGVVAGPLSGEGPLEVDFESMIDGGEGPYKCSWDYGDGTTGEGRKPIHTFEEKGNYSVLTTCIDSNGKTQSVITVIDVKDSNGDNIEKEVDLVGGIGLVVDASPLSGIGPLDVDFEVSVDGGIGPYTCVWDYGDGTTGEGIKPNHVFIDNGIYEVTTTCKDSNGEESSVTTIIRVSDKDDEVYIDDQLGLTSDAWPIYGEGPLDVDFEAKLEGGEGPYTCSWDYGDGTTGEGIKPNHVYYESGVYKVVTICVDANGLRSEIITAIIKVIDKLDVHCLSAYIEAKPISGNGPLNVDLNGIVSGCNPNFTYSWDLGDGTNASGKKLKHIFKQEGNYNVILTVEDEIGDIARSEILIKVTDNIDCSIDSDKDGINDCEDKCSLVFGDDKNYGCPIFEKSCQEGCSCGEGYVCSDSSEDSCKVDGVCLPEEKELPLGGCLDGDGKSGFNEANTICESCPCPVSIDFGAKVRSCDGIFPAITSPDSTKIYTRGGIYQIK